VVLALASGVLGCCGFPGWPGGRDRPAAASGDFQPGGDSGRAAEPATPGQVVVLDVALIERPGGDAFLDRELWDLGNEQGVGLETKPTLEENGLRVAQIGGLLPARLQALLTSPRSCPEPMRRLRAGADQGTVVQVGPERARLRFQAREGGLRAIDLADAVCFFEVSATPEGDRRVRLRFTPQVRHGKAEIKPRVARDPEGTLRWAVEAREPVEEFPALGWELTVGPDEYVLIGPARDRADTLGAAYFLAPSEKGPVQKLLVLRASLLADQPLGEPLRGVPPLALQASWTPPAGRR
jgi:hypothetical protein